MSATWWVRLVQRCVPLFPWSGLWLCYCDQSLPWMLRGTYPWLCGFHCPLCGESMLPGWWTRAPDLPLSCASICSVRLGGLVHPHWERSHWALLLSECSLRGVLCVSFHAAASAVWSYYWHCSCPTLSMCHPAYLTHMQSTSQDMLDWMKHKLE